MIRHSFAEGWLLLRRRAVTSFTLACALAIPLSLFGVTLSLSRWLAPLLDSASSEQTVALLLHPQLDDTQQQQWISKQQREHPDWVVSPVAKEQLIARLTHWFPYLEGLLEDSTTQLLPPLVEISNAPPGSFSKLEEDPAVIAVGPQISVHHLAKQVVSYLGWIQGGICSLLLLSAILLAAIWVHLELYRHADEIAIMRLIGATDTAINGPFLLASAAPGLTAAVLSCLGSLLLAAAFTQAVKALGLPRLTVSSLVLTVQAGVACALPLAAAALTLARYGKIEVDS